MPKITKSIVDQAQPGGRQIPVWDSEIMGLGLRVTPAGVKSYIFQYRYAGRSRRITIGKAYSIEPGNARNIGKRYAAMVAEGRDPKAEKDGAKARAAAERQRERDTVEKVASDFIEKYVKPKNRSWRKTHGIFARHVIPAWASRPVEAIRKRDALDLLDRVRETHGPSAANNVHAALRRFFNWAVEREVMAASPIAGLRRPAPSESRDRILTDVELAAIWEASGHLGDPFGPYVRVLILTAQRRNEVANMRWDQLDLDAGSWTLSREDTKAKREHVVPLSPQVLTLLSQQKGREGLVFTTTGTTGISGFGKAKTRLDKQSGVSGWTLHDLRRTAATGMARMGVPPHVVSRVLNHAPEASEGITAIYNRHSYQPEMRRALDTWAAHVTGTGEGETSKVVRLR